MGAAALVWWVGSGSWRLGGSSVESRVWTIGTDNARPYHFMNPDGIMGGMIAEVVNEAARRSGVRLRWLVRKEGPMKALTNQRADLWPLLSVQQALWPHLHFSKPYLRNSYILLCPYECEAGEDIEKIKRAALVNYPLAKKLARQALPQAALSLHPTREEAMAEVCRGGAEVAFMESRAAQFMMLHRPPECAGVGLHTYGLNIPPTALALASTAAGSPAAARLRAEIDVMLADGTMGRLMQKWNYYYSGEAEALFAEERTRRSGRLAMLLAGSLSIVVVALLVLVARTREARREAQAASAAKTQFLATMSHEIRTPLHGLLGMSQLLRESPLNGEQREYVEMLEQSGRTLLDLVNDVLDLARVERGKMELAVAAYEPARLFSAVLRAWEAQARQKGLELRAEGWEAMPARAMGDEARIRQVLANLLSNAVKFTDQGTVTLAVEMAGEGRNRQALVAVRDTGIGIGASSLELVFEQFSQADQTISRRYGGTGLGLSIARKLVELMGGSLGVRSREGMGSTFHFSLPMPEAPGEERGGAAAPSPPQAEGNRNGPPVRTPPVLLVEDNLVNQKIARKLLERAGCEVRTVGNGLEALAALEREAYSAIFMDCRMPVMDGLEATAELRRRGRQLPVIALTASAMAGEKEQCLAAGMDDYLTKPLELAELDRVLARWVRGGDKCGTLAHIPMREGSAK